VLTVIRTFKEVSEVIRAVKPTSEIGDNCPWCGNEANKLVRILLYLKTVF